MGYQSRKRNYKSRREKNAIAARNLRVTLIFLGLALLVLLFKNRIAIWDWLRLQFY